MEDVLIRRCRLRVLRRGGWHWGRNPRRLLEQATRVLPLLITEQLGHRLGRHVANVRIPALKIVLPATLAELERASVLRPIDGRHGGSTPLAERVRSEVERACAAILATHEPEAGTAPDTERRRVRLEPDPERLIRTLFDQYREGIVFRVLRLLPRSTLEAWEGALRLAVDEARGPERSISPPIAATIMAMLERELATDVRLPNTPRTRVAILVALLARYEAGIALSSIDDFIARQLDSGSTGEVMTARGRAVEPALPQTAALELSGSRATELVATPPTIAVSSVLPFVITGVLSRAGLLDTLSAALEAVELRDEADCIATAIAYKVGNDAQRGWRRDTATKTLAAAMTGTGDVPTNTRMASFLRRFDETAGLLAATAAARRAKAAQPAERLLLDRLTVRDASVWGLIDVAGGGAIAWSRDVAECLDYLGLYSDALLFINGPACSPSLLSRLDRDGVAWITNAPLEPSEHRAGPYPQSGLSTNRPEVLDQARADSIMAITRRAAGSRRLVKTFLDHRPLLLPAERYAVHDSELELSAAVAAACSDIAVRLATDETLVDPLMAFERFADLEGIVKFEDARVVVTPSLGQRFLDLYRNDLLRDVTGVPWLQGRLLRFGGL